MKTKHLNQKKYAKVKFDSHQVILSPYPPLCRIYHCYAQILMAARLPSFFDTKTELVYPTTDPSNAFLVLDNFMLLFTSRTQSLSIQARYIVHTDIDLPRLEYQLSSALFKLITELTIDIKRLHPNNLLHAFNTSLSKKAIYDLNTLHHEKPRCELSLDLLAKLMGCSRNQLLYQQKQINEAYLVKVQQLKQKCVALQYPEPSPELFWRASHGN